MIPNVIRRTCQLAVSKFDWTALCRGLASAGQVGVVYGAKNDLLERFGANGNALAPGILYPGARGVFGDLFLPNKETTLFLIARHEGSGGPDAPVTEDNVWEDPGRSGADSTILFEAGEVSPLTGTPGEALDRLIAAANAYLHGTLKVRERDIKWTERTAGAGDAPFAGIPATAPDAYSMELAAIFRDGKLNPLFETLGAKGSLVLDDFLEKADNREETEYYIDKLFEADFLTEEVVVHCRKTGQYTIRAKDRAALDALAERGISCFCGESLQNERICRLILLPERSRPFIAGNWAARTFLLNMLTRMGYPADAIQVSDDGGRFDLAFVPAEDGGLVFVLDSRPFDKSGAEEILRVLGKRTNVKLFVYGAGGVSPDAAALLSEKVGDEHVTLLSNLEEFNTTLLESLGRDRVERLAGPFRDIAGMLSMDLGALAMRRLEA
ncbi:hypothetical protein K8I61_00585 [bacterium]|nr:hypothetical protein [bacterium]